MHKQNNYKKHTVICIALLIIQCALSQSNAIADTKSDATLVTPATNPVLDSNATSSVESSKSETANEVTKAEQKEATDENKAVNYFDILEFQVQGNTKLSKAQIETAVYSHMGEKKTIDDVEKARDALEKTYHQTGYLTVLVDIPEQEVESKVVKLNVTEGKISKLRIKDSHYFSLGRIKELAPSVKEGEVPYFPAVQQDVARLNRTGDRLVTPVLKAGKAFGTVDV